MKSLLFLLLGLCLSFGATASVETSYDDSGVSIVCDVGSDSDIGDAVIMDECIVYSLSDPIISTNVIYIESFESVVLDVDQLPPATTLPYSLTPWKPLSNWVSQGNRQSDLYKDFRYHRFQAGIEPIKQC